MPTRVPPQKPKQAPLSSTFDFNFRTYEEQARYNHSYAKHKIRKICIIKMANFVEAKFKYLATFEEFGWMPYLTIQHSACENLIRVFFSNATLEEAGEEDEDPCYIVVNITFVMGVPIWDTQRDVATAFEMLDGLLPPTMLILDDNSHDLQLQDRLLHLFISHFF